MFGAFRRYVQGVGDTLSSIGANLDTPAMRGVQQFLKAKKPLFTTVLGSLSAVLMKSEGFSMRSIVCLSVSLGGGRFLGSAVSFLQKTCSAGIEWLGQAERAAHVLERVALIAEDAMHSDDPSPAVEEPVSMSLVVRVDRALATLESSVDVTERRLVPAYRVVKSVVGKNWERAACIAVYLFMCFCQALSGTGAAKAFQGLAFAAFLYKLLANTSVRREEPRSLTGRALVVA